MPPAYSLGFHFSKWAPIDAKIMMERNKQFTAHDFQVDVLWFDIDYTKDRMYFKFDPSLFKPQDLEDMNKQVFAQKRRFVVITDPHIAAK